MNKSPSLPFPLEPSLPLACAAVYLAQLERESPQPNPEGSYAQQFFSAWTGLKPTASADWIERAIDDGMVDGVSLKTVTLCAKGRHVLDEAFEAGTWPVKELVNLAADRLGLVAATPSVPVDDMPAPLPRKPRLH